MPRRSRIALLFAAVTVFGAAGTAATGTPAGADTCTPQVIQLFAGANSVAPVGSQMAADVRQVQQRDTNQYLQTDAQVIQDLLATVGRYGYHWNCATNQLVSSTAPVTPAPQGAPAPASPAPAGSAATQPAGATATTGAGQPAGDTTAPNAQSADTTEPGAASAAPSGSPTTPATADHPPENGVALPATAAGSNTGPLSSVAFDVIVALLVLSVLGVFGAWRFNTSRARRRAT